MEEEKKYQILARKYRPQQFQDVVGQKAIITTIKNAIKFQKTAHAYLFSGSRGVGKTTLARVFAKALNCKNLQEDMEPCNQCQSCKEITNGSSLDVMEIDGASNRGIDDIRHINETIRYSPSEGSYKIYIIDEVHMLTKEAFNALLKTLEEPPANVKFFFATTEPHKVLPTIISRCQRFDLSRIDFDSITERLKQIALDQKREIEEDAIFLLARLADGSLRDATSLLDQILCFEEGVISEKMVSETLGCLPIDDLFALDEAIAKEDISFAFLLSDQLQKKGKDLTYFFERLFDHFRIYAFLKLQQKSPILISQEYQKQYEKNAQKLSLKQVLYIIEHLLGALQQMQKVPSPKIVLEMALVNIIRSANFVDISDITRRLVHIETSLKNSEKESFLKTGEKEEIPGSSHQLQPSVEPIAENPSPSSRHPSLDTSSNNFPTDTSKLASATTKKEGEKPKKQEPIDEGVKKERKQKELPSEVLIPKAQETIDPPKSLKDVEAPIHSMQEALSSSAKNNNSFPATQASSTPDTSSTIYSSPVTVSPPISPEKAAPLSTPSTITSRTAADLQASIASPAPPKQEAANANHTPSREQKKETPAVEALQKKHPSHYDTLLRFAAVEFEGTAENTQQ